MMAPCDDGVIVLTGEGGDPDVVSRYRVTAAFQFMAYLGIYASRSLIYDQHAASGEELS